MNDLRTAAQQALEALEASGCLAFKNIMCRCSELCGSYTAAQHLRAALAQQAEPVTEDMKSAVRWAPSSAYWSQRLREFFGPDAREGIDALERRLAEAQQAEPVQEPVATLIAQRDALLEALKLIQHATAPTHNDGAYHEAAHDICSAAIMAVEEKA